MISAAARFFAALKAAIRWRAACEKSDIERERERGGGREGGRGEYIGRNIERTIDNNDRQARSPISEMHPLLLGAFPDPFLTRSRFGSAFLASQSQHRLFVVATYASPANR